MSVSDIPKAYVIEPPKIRLCAEGSSNCHTINSELPSQSTNMEVTNINNTPTEAGIDAEEEEEPDPRVKNELDCLNTASCEINKLETELGKARNKFRSLLQDCTGKLQHLHKDLGKKCVSKSRPYYETMKEATTLTADAQAAALRFQRAISIYRTAKETVSLAEQRSVECPPGVDRAEFDRAWQDMLNHATLRFVDAEREKAQSEAAHLSAAAACACVQKKMAEMEKDMPRSIKKAKPYFDLKDRLEMQLKQEKLNVDDLQRALAGAKHLYRTSLENLEKISEQIHASRRLPLPPRTPGVGAEAADLQHSDTDTTLSFQLDNISQYSGYSTEDTFDLTDSSSMASSEPGSFPRSPTWPTHLTVTAAAAASLERLSFTADTQASSESVTSPSRTADRPVSPIEPEAVTSLDLEYRLVPPGQRHGSLHTAVGENLTNSLDSDSVLTDRDGAPPHPAEAVDTLSDTMNHVFAPRDAEIPEEEKVVPSEALLATPSVTNSDIPSVPCKCDMDAQVVTLPEDSEPQRDVTASSGLENKADGSHHEAGIEAEVTEAVSPRNTSGAPGTGDVTDTDVPDNDVTKTDVTATASGPVCEGVPDVPRENGGTASEKGVVQTNKDETQRTTAEVFV